MGLGEAFNGVLEPLVRGNMLIVLMGLAPGIFWLWWFYRRDLEPEPIRHIVVAFVMGALLTIPAVIVQSALEPLVRSMAPSPVDTWAAVCAAVVIAPISEETLKFLATVFIIHRLDEFDEPMDGIIYGVSVALGFAALENVGYLFGSFNNGLAALTHTAIVRTILSVPAHALFACVWGYALGRARFDHHGSLLSPYPLVALLAAMSAHSLFNLGCLLEPLFGFGLVGVVVVLWEITEPRIQAFIEQSPHADQPDYRVKLHILKSRIWGVRTPEKRWFESRATVLILLFVIFAPAGLYGLHRTTAIVTHLKWVYLAIWLGVSIAAAMIGVS